MASLQHSILSPYLELGHLLRAVIGKMQILISSLLVYRGVRFSSSATLLALSYTAHDLDNKSTKIR